MANKKSGAIASMSEGDWRAKSDLETLLEAERIKRDPSRLKAVRSCAKQKKDDLVGDLGAITEVEEKEE